MEERPAADCGRLAGTAILIDGCHIVRSASKVCRCGGTGGGAGLFARPRRVRQNDSLRDRERDRPGRTSRRLADRPTVHKTADGASLRRGEIFGRTSKYLFSLGFACVAAAILAAVEGGILPPGSEVRPGSASPTTRPFRRAGCPALRQARCLPPL